MCFAVTSRLDTASLGNLSPTTLMRRMPAQVLLIQSVIFNKAATSYLFRKFGTYSVLYPYVFPVK